MRTKSCRGFSSLIALVAAGLVLPTVQAAEVSSSAVVGVVLHSDKLTVLQASSSAMSTRDVTAHARISESVPGRSLASNKVWKTCPAIRVESTCARYA
jgi:hypothetical protein